MGDKTRKERNAGARAGALVPNYFALCVGDWGFFVGLPSPFVRLCKSDINIHILISQNVYSQNFSSICTKLWCRKTDGSGRCTSSVGGDGLRCGNKKVQISKRSLFNFQFRLYTVFHNEECLNF